MNLISVKSISQAKLDGITVEWTKTDNSIRDVTFTDVSGNKVIVAMSSYSMSVMVPKPLEEADRYILGGSYLGMVDVKEAFEHQHEADAKLSEYKEKAGYRDDIGLSITKAKVKVDDGGAPVANALDEIPF